MSPSLAALIADQSNDCVELVATPAYSPLAYCPERNVVWIGRAGRAALVEVLIADDARVESAHFSRSGTILALTFDDYSIRLFDARTGRPRAAMRGHAAGRPAGRIHRRRALHGKRREGSDGARMGRGPRRGDRQRATGRRACSECDLLQP